MTYTVLNQILHAGHDAPSRQYRLPGPSNGVMNTVEPDPACVCNLPSRIIHRLPPFKDTQALPKYEAGAKYR
jgi:hypothetical protein